MLLLLSALLPVLVRQQVGRSVECHLEIGARPLPSATPRRNVGFLIGVGPATPDDAITQLVPHVVRGPFSSQPFWTQQATRLARLGVGTLQLILGPQILEQEWVAAEPARNISALRAACWPHLDATCPLPGSVSDPHLKKWASAISQTMDAVERLPFADRVVYDIWNEPNFVGGPGGGGGGWAFPSAFWKPGPADRQGLNYTDFWAVWNVAVRTIRAKQPQATIVGPSSAPGPGTPEGSVVGWQPQQQWLEQFVLQAHANNTMPDILSWHDYTGRPAMVGSMQEQMRGFMSSHGIPNAQTIPIGYNEIVDSAHSQSAGYHVAMSAALEQTMPPTDHAALGCWAEPGPTTPAGASTCWDQSLDGLLDPSANFSKRPAWHALRWYAELPQDTRRWPLQATSNSSSDGDCHIGGLAVAADGTTTDMGAELVILVGRWNAASSNQLQFDLGPSEVARSVKVERLPGCAQLEPCPAGGSRAEPAIHVPAGPTGRIDLELGDAEALRLVVVQS